MKTINCSIVVLTVSLIAGCASTSGDPNASSTSKTDRGVALGAVLGAVAGALVASGDNRAKGAIIGALAGAAIGHVIGSYQDRQTATREQAVQRYGLASIDSSRLEVEDAAIAPQTARAGTVVESSVQYTTLVPGENSQVNMHETRTLVAADNSVVQLGDRQVARAQGSHNSTIKFTIPRDFPAGDYRLVTTLSDGQQTKTVERPLQVI